MDTQNGHGDEAGHDDMGGMGLEPEDLELVEADEQEAERLEARLAEIRGRLDEQRASRLAAAEALLPKDLRDAARTLGPAEARYLVDSYYQLQHFRITAHNQVRSLTTGEEPHATLVHFGGQFGALEEAIGKALDVYSRNQPMGRWAREHVGIGPVIAAGLLAHVPDDLQTAGQLWSFAGLNPEQVWERGQKRPWNARLKLLCWKMGDSFVKQKGRDGAFYGKLYEQRKAYEVERDERGGNAETARRTLGERTFRDAATKATYESGHLPAGRLELRARRWAVKLFLAHYFEADWRLRHGTEPPNPYPIEHLGHAHKIESPVPGPQRD